MYIKNDIAYAGSPAELLRVTEVRALEDHRLFVRFQSGEGRVFDMTPLLTTAAFAPLKDTALFQQVTLDHGVPVWQGGDIDLAPETLFQQGSPVPGSSIA